MKKTVNWYEIGYKHSRHNDLVASYLRIPLEALSWTGLTTDKYGNLINAEIKNK